MLWPNGTTARPNVSSQYGMRWHPILKRWKLHAGCDLTGYQLVRAIAPGKVVAVGVPTGWTAGGIQVWVQHDGFLSRSMHLKSAPPVRFGDVIPEGRILGVMGMTGGADGIHHHLEVVVNGVQVDPIPFITNRLATAAGGKAPASTPETSEEDIVKNLLFQIDPRVDGRWVVANTSEGTYYKVDNGVQLDFLRNTGTIDEVHGAQSPAVIAGFRERG